MRFEPRADAAQAGDGAAGVQPLHLQRIGRFGGGRGGQGNDQVGPREPCQQARLQHVLAAPHAHRVQPKGTLGIVAPRAQRHCAGGRFARTGGAPQPCPRPPRRLRFGRRNGRCPAHRVGEQHDPLGGTAGGNHGVTVAPVEHRVADIVSGRVGRPRHLAPQPCQVGRARVLRKVVHLQNHRLPGGRGQQDRAREAGVLGQVMVVDPPHAVAETVAQQVGELPLAGGGGGRIVVAHGVEAHALDRRVKTAVFRTAGDHRQAQRFREQVAVGEQGAGRRRGSPW